MRKHGRTWFAVVCLVVVLGATGSAQAATQQQIDQSVTNGLAWLATQQNPDGSFGSYYPLGATGFAVWAFNEHALHIGVNPLSPAYPYAAQVQAGLNFIFTYASTMTSAPGDPDGNGDGQFVYFSYWAQVYETALAVLAVTTSQSPGAVVNVPASAVNGWTYQNVAQDVLDVFAWGQGHTGCDTGGWGYGLPYPGWSDQSSSGYVVFALKFLRDPLPGGFGLAIPSGVLAALSTYVNNVQDPVDGSPDGYDGGSWYEPCSGYKWVNVYKAGHLLSEMLLAGDLPTSTRFLNAIDYIQRHWNDLGPQPEFPSTSLGWKDDYHSTFTMTKGLLGAGITSLTVGGNPIDWFDEVSTYIVSTQNPNGSWPLTSYEGGEDSQVLTTAWALLAAQRAGLTCADVVPSGIETVGSLCVGAVATAGVTPAGDIHSYYWSITNYSGFAQLLGPSDGPSISFRATQPGTIAVELTITPEGPCPPTNLWKEVTILPTPATPVIVAPQKATIGETGLQASVEAHPGSTYAWSLTNGTITAGQGTSVITFTAGGAGSAELTVTETNASGCVAVGTASVPVVGAAGPCLGDATSLCLNQSRFKVSVEWEKVDGTTGAGQAVPFAPAPPDTGYFWFFEPTNVELLVKVLDGRGVNGKFWVMYGALSDVDYTVTVLDSFTGATKTYHNAQGTMASFADVNAFEDTLVRPGARGDWLAESRRRGEVISVSGLWASTVERTQEGAAGRHAVVTSRAPALAAAAGCTEDQTTLCLNGGRFQATSSWALESPNGTYGPGRSVPVTPDTGCFWFFNARNIELAVKVLDGTGVNGKYWVLYGALSDVDYDLTIVDTVTGARKTYSNPQGRLASHADIEAFTP